VAWLVTYRVVRTATTIAPIIRYRTVRIFIAVSLRAS
jgi:hypothetical protein